jgi:hypothetical protein
MMRRLDCFRQSQRDSACGVEGDDQLSQRFGCGRQIRPFVQRQPLGGARQALGKAIRMGKMREVAAVRVDGHRRLRPFAMQPRALVRTVLVPGDDGVRQFRLPQ